MCERNIPNWSIHVTELVLRVVRYDCKVAAIKRWLIYDVHNFNSFWISPACLWAWSRRRLDCNWHRRPISVGYAWREFFETPHIHGNKLLYVRTDNNCHLSTVSRKQTLWWHNTKGCRTKHRQVAQESICTGGGAHFTFSFEIPFNNIKVKFSRINCLRFCCKLCIISKLVSTHRK